MQISARAGRVEPFYVMQMAREAARITRDAVPLAPPMIHLNVGEPDFTAPPLVQEAAQRAIANGNTAYTDSAGLPALRERISQWYRDRFALNIDPGRIVVTAGASAALQLACLALIDVGDEILMPDPSYPCNRQFVNLAGGRAVLLPSSAAERFQLSAAQVEAAWGDKTRGVMLASPSNPTGTSIHPDELARIHAAVQARGGTLFIDEIYLGLSYDETYGQSALTLSEDVISINSFSKYFSMTGWRLGWLVLPPALVPTIEQMAQHLYICPNTIAQHAALACFEPESLAEYERRRTAFRARRDWFVPALERLGLTVPVAPDGAFYAWANCKAACQALDARRGHVGAPSTSWELAMHWLQDARVAVTPGRDFGPASAAHWIRFSTASAMAQLQEAVARLEALTAH